MKKITPSEAHARGRKNGAEAKAGLRESIEAAFQSTRKAFPASAHLDYAQELLKLDQLRMESVPSLTRFPESKGWPDRLIAERKGFLEGCGGGPLELAFYYTWAYFMSCRMNTRYVGTGVPKGECTAVFIRNSKEGGPLFGRNWDMPHHKLPEFMDVPTQGPDHIQRLFVKGVSSGTFCDEEPEEIYPLNPFKIIPDDCRLIKDVVPYLQRYADFWAAHNGILVDEENSTVAYEKLNRRVGFRYSNDGSSAVTACAVVIPEIKAFRDERHRLSLKLRGLDEHSMDWHYWKGCEARYNRLLKLVADASRNGATIWDMVHIVTDHAVPYPDRVCIAGETCHPGIDPKQAEWTMTSRAMVLSGPNRRVLYFRVEGDKACYENRPFLVLGRDVKLDPEWLKGTRSDPSLPNPVSCMPEDKELTEDTVLRLYSDVVWRNPA